MSAEKFSERGGGQRKLALLSLFRGRGEERKKTEKIAKKDRK